MKKTSLQPSVVAEIRRLVNSVCFAKTYSDGLVAQRAKIEELLDGHPLKDVSSIGLHTLDRHVTTVRNEHYRLMYERATRAKREGRLEAFIALFSEIKAAMDRGQILPNQLGISNRSWKYLSRALDKGQLGETLVSKGRRRPSHPTSVLAKSQ